MPSHSPEQEQTATMLRGLCTLLSKLDPTEHKAHVHLNMSMDPDADEAAIALAYKYDKEHVHVSFMELQRFFDENYKMAAAFLSDQWDVDQRNVGWPIDESQQAASYFVTLRKEDYMVTTSRWLQPVPNETEPVEMIAASYEPAWSLSPTIRVIYFGGEPLISCKFNAHDPRSDESADWSHIGELTPDDVMTAEKVTKRIPFHVFDTTP